MENLGHLARVMALLRTDTSVVQRGRCVKSLKSFLEFLIWMPNSSGFHCRASFVRDIWKIFFARGHRWIQYVTSLNGRRMDTGILDFKFGRQCTCDWDDRAQHLVSLALHPETNRGADTCAGPSKERQKNTRKLVDQALSNEF